MISSTGASDRPHEGAGRDRDPVADLDPPLPHVGPDLEGASDADVEEAARVAVREHTEAVIRSETAREGQRRASLLAADVLAERPAGMVGSGGSTLPDHVRRPPLRLQYPRWGWRRAIRHAVERRMLTGQYLTLYRRFLWQRARAVATGNHVVFQGVVFTGKRVEFRGRPGHGRLVVGPWCWIGDDNKLRAHEGQLTLGAKVVMGRDNVVNTYLDVEIGEASILADWIYVCDFDHRFERLDVPIKDQGIAKSPVRIGADVWIGEKASILRGVDIGHGSVIASHGLVKSDIPPFSIAVGIPARVVKSRLPDGIDPEEALDRLRRGLPIPGDPIG